MKTRWTCSGPNVSLADGFHHVIESSGGIKLIATTQKSAEGIAKILNLLEEKAEFAEQCMQDHFENAFVEATIHKQLVRAASAAVIAFGSETEGEAIDHLRRVLFGNVYSIIQGACRMKVWKFDADDLVMSATSYHLGRMTAMVEVFCQNLIESWPELPEKVRCYVRHIVEDAYRRNQLGHDCDRRSWDGVRALWSEEDGNSF